MDIPYPIQQTMSSNHRPAGEMPFKCLRCCIAKKEEGGGGGVGDRLESLGEPIQFLWCFFACVVFVRFGGGGVNCWYSLFH